MSNLRQGIVARTYAVTHPPNLDIAPRSFPDWDQLLFAKRGVMEVLTPAGRFVVPPHRGVWIPAATQVGIEMSGAVALRSLFVRPELRPGAAPQRCQALNVSALLRELILHANAIGVLWETEPAHVRLAHVILDQLEVADRVALRLPFPTDPRASRTARALLDDPSCLDDALKVAGASRRTVERLFGEQTGLSLGRWHQRARVRRALQLLAAGRSVGAVAADVGYKSSSSFVAAFRRQFGETPARYIAGS